MNQNLDLLVTCSIVFGISGFYITKYAYRRGSDWGYRGKMLGPGFILFALVSLYKALEEYFGW